MPGSAARSRRIRALIVLATAGIGLILAEPAFPAISDAPPEAPSETSVVAGVPAADATAIAVPGLPDTQEAIAETVEAVDEATEDIVTTVQAEAGNLDVSVRVLSPGSNGPVVQEESEPAVISEPHDPDITAAPEPAPSVDASPQSTDVPENTNVVVRVLSPGDNGPVTQKSAAAEPGEAELRVPVVLGGDESAPAPAGDSTTPDALSPSDSGRYHEENSESESKSSVAEEPWNWGWELSVDCDGSATSTSTESGSRSSSIWAWDWTWKWACADPARPPPATQSVDTTAVSGPAAGSPGANTNVSIRVLSPGADGPVTQSSGSQSTDGGMGIQPASGTSPWSWNWAFTFCDTTSTLSSDLDLPTSLTWTWNWSWAWTCEPAAGSQPEPKDSTQAPGAAPQSSETDVISPAPGPPDGQQTTPRIDVLVPFWPRSLGTLPLVPFDVFVAVELPRRLGGVVPHLSLSPLESLELGAPLVLGASATPPLGLVAAPPRQWTRRPPRPTASKTLVAPVAPPRVASSASETHAGAEDGAEARKPSQPTARPAPRGERQRLPLLGQPGPGQRGGSGASSGRVPSTSVLAVAALAALFTLAAPNAGRRIRVARELSPRGVDTPPIDHPG